MFSDSPSQPNNSLLISDDYTPSEPLYFGLPCTKVWQKTKAIIGATLTTSLSLVYISLANLISLAFTSQLKSSSMVGGIGLGFVCSNCCVYTAFMSINQGVNVLAAQAYGASKHSLVSLNYHRGLFALLVSIIPALILLSFTQPILRLLGIDGAVAEYSWEYVRYAYPSFIFYGIFDCTKSYLYAQNVFKPVLYTQTVTIVLHLFWSWLFIYKLGMGCAGAGLAKDILELSNMALLFAIILITKCCEQNWVPFLKIQWKNEVLVWEGMKSFLKTVVPIAVLMLLDMASFEIFTVIAGRFGEDQLAVHVAFANTIGTYYCIPLGLSVTIMTFVANSMGEGSVNAAKNYAFCAIGINIFTTTIFVGILAIFQNQWASLFASNDFTKELLLEIVQIYYIFVFFDGFQSILSGTLKGIGKPKAAFIAVFISYYVVTMPLIYLIAFKLGFKVKGIWYAFLCGIALLFVLYAILLSLSNFQNQAKKINKELDRNEDIIQY